MQHLIWMCLESWKLNCLPFSYKRTLSAYLEGLAGERSHAYPRDRRTVLSPIRGGGPFPPAAYGFGRDAHGTVREEGDTRLAS